MADGQGTFGGGGSVHFSIDVNDGEAPEVTSKGGQRAYLIRGVDKHRKSGSDPDYFFLNIQPPPGGTIRAVPDGNGIRLYVQVDEKQPNQMRVEWAFKEAEVPAGTVDVVAVLKSGGAPVA